MSTQPLASRMRPKKLSDVIGQSQVIGKDSFLMRSVKNQHLPSIVFWGPPGCGKTTIARLLAQEIGAEFLTLQAVTSGLKEFRKIINEALENKINNLKTVLFIDEIHRWNKKQQDALLPYVEDGTIVFIGATTENPSFEIISALLSRLKVIVLAPLKKDQLVDLLQKALADSNLVASASGQINQVGNKALEMIAEFSGGDARVALNALELVVASLDVDALGGVPDSTPRPVLSDKKAGGQIPPANKIKSDKKASGQIPPANKVKSDKKASGQIPPANKVKEIIKQVFDKTQLLYDKAGEEHYNIVSAFIKSMRGSNADASIYYLARMIEGGEKPEFIARRMLIFASEDIGNALPTALVVANACFDAIHKIGWPESNLILAQTAIYLAKAPKSNLAKRAINRAQAEVRESGNLPVPLHLRNAPTKLMKNLGYGRDYIYTHDQPDAPQDFLPDSIKNKKFV